MMRNFAGIASNEGRIRFLDGAYDSMIWLDGVPDADYRDTVRDVERIFHAVAWHEMTEHNAAVRPGDRAHRIPADEMPGLADGDVVVAPFSKCLLPTSLVIGEPCGPMPAGIFGFGEVRINENFVKLLTKLKPTLRAPKGEIQAFPDQGQPEVIGELYCSIIHSVAVHAIRGLFPVNKWGFAVFTGSQRRAQGERGRKRLYVNLLALMFYWAVLVERDPYPRKRAEAYMRGYPELFSGLAADERRRLPVHLLRQCSGMIDRNAFPFPFEVVRTGMTAEDVERVLCSRSGI